MSRWQLHLPHRSLDAPVGELVECARHLPEPDDWSVTRELATVLQLEHGCHTVRDATTLVKTADQATRRAFLDRARQRAGLPPAAEVEARERVKRDSYSEFVKAAHDPRPLRLGYSASGAIIDINEREDDAARAEQEERSRRARREAREAERRVEAAELAEHERAWRERLDRELPPGIVG